MNWANIIEDLRAAGLTQAQIGAKISKSQSWVCNVAAGQYSDLRWSDGEALMRLHSWVVGRKPKKAATA